MRCSWVEVTITWQNSKSVVLMLVSSRIISGVDLKVNKATQLLCKDC